MFGKPGSLEPRTLTQENEKHDKKDNKIPKHEIQKGVKLYLAFARPLEKRISNRAKKTKGHHHQAKKEKHDENKEASQSIEYAPELPN